MENRSVSIPFGMVFGKFYCHKCGARLKKHPVKRTVRPGDPDYKEHSKTGKMFMVGDVEVTEYDFRCPQCEHEIVYKDQRMVAKIQKNLGKKVLTEEEINEHTQAAKALLARDATICKILFAVAFLALSMLVFYLKGRS